MDTDEYSCMDEWSCALVWTKEALETSWCCMSSPHVRDVHHMTVCDSDIWAGMASMGHDELICMDNPRSEGIPMWSRHEWSSGLLHTESENPLYGPIRAWVDREDVEHDQQASERHTELFD